MITMVIRIGLQLYTVVAHEGGKTEWAPPRSFG